MVIGNFCLLSGIDPAQVDEWYLGIYIDAIEWVEMPNTRGMSQFADGGLIASKPYTASGYWHFMDRHKGRFSKNPRIGMVYRNLNKMDASIKEEVINRGTWVLDNLDRL